MLKIYKMIHEISITCQMGWEISGGHVRYYNMFIKKLFDWFDVGTCP